MGYLHWRINMASIQMRQLNSLQSQEHTNERVVKLALLIIIYYLMIYYLESRVHKLLQIRVLLN